jgi:hypothetical protein
MLKKVKISQKDNLNEFPRKISEKSPEYIAGMVAISMQCTSTVHQASYKLTFVKE